MFPLDVDSGGLPAIQALLTECRRRKLWAFGQYTPRLQVAEEDQHGYVAEGYNQQAGRNKSGTFTDFQ